MDGNGTLFGTLSGNTRDVVHKFSVDLPKKHGRGGQSALRFARLREEKRHNYVRKVAELAVQNYITNDKVNVAGLILAGSADFKNDLNQSDMFDNRLQSKVIQIVDVSYGGENGFNQAIELASETLSNVKFIQEKKLIGRYFDEISQDSGRVCYGIEDTLKALEFGAAETLIVYENLDVTRWVLKSSDGSEVILHTTKAQEISRELFMDKESGQEMEVVDQSAFLEWLAEKYKDFGATLEFVSDRSSEGNQFVKGFGGIGAMLRYKVNFEQLADFEEEDEFYDGEPTLYFFLKKKRENSNCKTDIYDSLDWRCSNLALSEEVSPAAPPRVDLTASRSQRPRDAAGIDFDFGLITTRPSRARL